MKFRIPKRFKLLLLALLSGVLMSISWPIQGFPYFIFLGFVPLFFIEKQLVENKASYSRGAAVLYSYPAFLVWNLLTTWWVSYASLFGGIAAILLNALFMSLIFGVYHSVRTRVFKSKIGYFSIVVFWIAYEYLHSDWDLSWSWLTLGNVFSNHYYSIQWYEFTGVYGGTFWILFGNVLLFLGIDAWKNSSKKHAYYFGFSAAFLIALPILFSGYLYTNAKDKGELAEVIAIQPNVDPYNAEFTTSDEMMIHNLLQLSRGKVSSKTQLIIFPESSIQESIWENESRSYKSMDSIQAFLAQFPNASIITGASTLRMLNPEEEIKAYARIFPFDSTKYYYHYNTAIFCEYNKEPKYYHKSRLVPGVEKMPFIAVMKHFENFAIDLGGTTGTLGRDSLPQIFGLTNSFINAAPIICYESIYGEVVGEFVLRGANLICIITNDGWWQDTPGYRQHFSYARLRAIETRRSIARAANTGISGFINQRGDDFKAQPWWTQACIKQELALNNELTFYVRYGDYIARISLFVSALLVLVYFSYLAKIKLNRAKEN